MIVLRSPKGWTGPKEVDGLPSEGTFRAHQVPVTDLSKPGHLKILEDWMKSYRPGELFDDTGKLRSEIAELAPTGDRRMGANPQANGGVLLRDLRTPSFADYAVDVPAPGAVEAEEVGAREVRGRRRVPDLLQIGRRGVKARPIRRRSCSCRGGSLKIIMSGGAAPLWICSIRVPRAELRLDQSARPATTSSNRVRAQKLISGFR